MKFPKDDLVGKRFERWEVLEFSEYRDTHPYWLCKCNCGIIKPVIATSLTRGKSKSCGCLKPEISRAKATTHGLRFHPLYVTWCNMKLRCYGKGRKEYPDYGGRGIFIDRRWRKNFKAFYSWSIENGWELGLMIDRIDNDGPYAPWNCRWVTNKEQSNNRRNDRTIRIFGECLSMSAAYDKYANLKIKPSVLFSRIRKGWDPERASQELAKEHKEYHVSGTKRE